MRCPPAPPIKAPDHDDRVFLFLDILLASKSKKRPPARNGRFRFLWSFLFDFCFCSFFASVHFFCSEDTPII